MLFLFGICLFFQLRYSWWWLLALLLLPDLSRVEYLAQNRGITIVIYLLGIYLSVPLLQLAGLLLFAHTVRDRMPGYGLKNTILVSGIPTLAK